MCDLFLLHKLFTPMFNFLDDSQNVQQIMQWSQIYFASFYWDCSIWKKHMVGFCNVTVVLFFCNTYQLLFPMGYIVWAQSISLILYIVVWHIIVFMHISFIKWFNVLFLICNKRITQREVYKLWNLFFTMIISFRKINWIK